MLTSCNIQVCKRSEMKIVPGISKPVCNEHGTIYAISSDFGDRMTTQHLD